MNCRQKRTLLLKGLMFGGLFLFSLLVVSGLTGRPATKTAISYDEAVNRLESKQIREINLENKDLYLLDRQNVRYAPDVSERQKIELLDRGSAVNIAVTFNDGPPFLFYVFQILFWLFLVSPPVIVVLLLVIIRKMDAKK